MLDQLRINILLGNDQGLYFLILIVLGFLLRNFNLRTNYFGCVFARVFPAFFVIRAVFFFSDWLESFHVRFILWVLKVFKAAT